MYDFDKIIDMTNTNSMKFNFNKEEGKPDDVFPMWVADMDFPLPKEILDDLKEKVNHGIFGYSRPDQEYFDIIYNWFNKRHGIELKKEWLVNTPNVMSAIVSAIRGLTYENDFVLINNPVYYPFSEVIINNKRQIVSSDLVLKEGKYYLDFEDLENKIKNHNVKLYIFCSPHNPVGRVWTKNELDEIIRICKKHDVVIISDEIHCDFVWKGSHYSLFRYQDYLDKMILCTSPSKSFNHGGILNGNAFIPNREIRRKVKFENIAAGNGLSDIFGLVLCKAAYSKGDVWLDELKAYLLGNIAFVKNFLSDNLPNIKVIEPEATYLLWIDFRALNLADKEINDLLLNKAKLWLNSGAIYGEPGEGFQRMNIALPRKQLEDAMIKLKAAVGEQL